MTDDSKSERASQGTDGTADRRLDGASQASIENHLRIMFEEVASEPVPDRFLTLLNQLERDESRDTRRTVGDGRGSSGPATRSLPGSPSGLDGSE